ncbi:MAG: Acg family FMN-binding oxidoreductase [Frankia sp.]
MSPENVSTLASETIQGALHDAAARATLAPSIHNTQPWRLVVRPGHLDLYADLDRHLPAIDPSGRQMAISCGAAVFGARAALAAARLDTVTTTLPDAGRPNLLATIAVSGVATDPDEALGRLDAIAPARHSNRRQFARDPVPDAVVDLLAQAAELEGAWLQPLRDPEDRVTVATLSQHADGRQNADPAYRAELRNWTTDDPARRDGVPAAAVPHTTGAAHDDIPIRDFDTTGAGLLPGETHSRLTQTMVVLGTDGDNRSDWLAAGQALARVLLELTRAGFVASILSQVIEEPGTRQQLRTALRLPGHPALMLRIGSADSTPATPRRLATEVITIEG